MSEDFAPWARGCAHREGNTITGTLVLKAEARLKLKDVEIVYDGQGMVFVFDVMEGDDDPAV